MTTHRRAPRTSRHLAFAVGVLALGAAVLVGDLRAVEVLQNPRSGPAPASISGVVVDGVTRQPVPGARVVVNGVPVFPVPPDIGCCIVPLWAIPECDTTSDSEGRFTCERLDPWPYIVHARTDAGWGDYGQQDPFSAERVLTVEPGERVVDVRVPVWQHATLSGRVVDANGEPLVDMQITAIPVAELGSRQIVPESRRWTSATTDARGVYSIAVRAGEYLVLARPGTSTMPRPEVNGRPGTYPPMFAGGARSVASAQRLTLAAGAKHDVGFTMPPVAAARMTVRVPADVEDSVTTVEVVPDDAEHAAWQWPVVRYESRPERDGRFALTDIPPGDYRLRVVRQAYMPVGSDGLVPLEFVSELPTLWTDMPVAMTGEDLDVDIVLRRGVRVMGRVLVTGEDGPLPFAGPTETFLLPRLSGPDVDVRGMFLASGTLASIELPPGRYLLRLPYLSDFFPISATQGGRSILNQPFDVGTSPVTDVRITYGREPTHLFGHVTRPSALADVRGAVTIVPADTEAWSDGGREALMRTVRIGIPGVYDMDVLPGDYVVMASDVPVPRTPAGVAAMDAHGTRVTVPPGVAKALDLELRELGR